MYPGLEGFIEHTNPISCQEPKLPIRMVTQVLTCQDDLQNAFVVLQYPQEDAHQSISFDVLVRTLGKEDVCFVEKHDTVPRLCKLKRGV